VSSGETKEIDALIDSFYCSNQFAITLKNIFQLQYHWTFLMFMLLVFATNHWSPSLLILILLLAFSQSLPPPFFPFILKMYSFPLHIKNVFFSYIYMNFLSYFQQHWRKKLMFKFLKTRYLQTNCLRKLVLQNLMNYLAKNLINMRFDSKFCYLIVWKQDS
jgi:hypothetical protein